MAVAKSSRAVLQDGKAEYQRQRNAKRHQHFRLPFAPLHDNVLRLRHRPLS